MLTLHAPVLPVRNQYVAHRVRPMSSALADDEAVAAFARDGVVCLRQVLDAGEVAAAAEAIDAVLARPGPLAQVASRADDPGAFTEDFRRWQEIPQIERLADFLTVHGAAGFPYRTRRRILSLRYLSADARYAPRPWRTSPPFDTLDAELPAGAPMAHPCSRSSGPPDPRLPEPAPRLAARAPTPGWRALHGDALAPCGTQAPRGALSLERSWKLCA
jgi:hypothetical protein